MSDLPREFPKTVSTTNPSCRVILNTIREINRERRGTPKQVCCLTTLTGSQTGIHIDTSKNLGRKLFSTRYVELFDCYLIQVNPRIFSSSSRIRQFAYEVLAMMRRGVREWVEKDPITGEVVRKCRNAYGLSPDTDKRNIRYQTWVKNGRKRKKERRHNSIAHC